MSTFQITVEDKRNQNTNHSAKHRHTQNKQQNIILNKRDKQNSR